MSTEPGGLEPDPPTDADSGSDSDATHPVPSRENVIEFLNEADHEDELDQATYWVQRAIAETLLLLHDQRRS
jgi:hypothetical protein